MTAKGVVARLEGVGDRTAAEALKGVELYVDRDRLPAAAEGEFYHADLIGLAAVDPRGQAHRRDRRRAELRRRRPAGDPPRRLAARPSSSRSPMRTVPEVDIAAGRVVVALPAASDGEEEE